MELHFQNWYVTRLREAVDASATTIYVDVPPTINSGILVLESSVANKREIVYFNGVTGYALQNCVRGLEGTTPNTHNQGATVSQEITAGQAEQMFASAMQQGMGEDQDAPMSQWAIKKTLNQVQQFRGEQDAEPALAFVVDTVQPVADPNGKIIVWFEPL
jgi:hypothetical protein